MIERVFLGWSQPFLPTLVDHLLLDRDALATTLILVPTSQSGRILRENLAATAGAILSPKVATPGSLLHLDDPTIAPKWLETLAWVETLEAIRNWETHTALFPIPPTENADWASSFATEIVTLRANLQEHLLDLNSAAQLLSHTAERARWTSLARLEELAEKKLQHWQHTSRSAALRKQFALPHNYQKIILAGLTELPPCLTKALLETTTPITTCIAAPETEQNHFTELGIPTESWADRKLPLAAPHVTTQIVADPATQSQAALQAISATKASSHEIALGSADDDVGALLTTLLTDHGWPAYHPAARPPLPGLLRWLRVWKDWLKKPTAKTLTALLTLPETSPLISGQRSQKLILLNDLRDRNPAIEPATLLRLLQNSQDEPKQKLHAAIQHLLTRRENFLNQTFASATTQLLHQLKPSDETSLKLANDINDWLENAAAIIATIPRPHLHWLQTLLSEIPRPNLHPPHLRCIDIQGWLELLYEPGPHLVICGINETMVPPRPQGEPWLSENIRQALTLPSAKNRHARDAFLLQTILEMRSTHGSAHLICGKTASNGEPLLPSRLLLQIDPQHLVSTVKNLFREIEPPEANLARQTDWKWQPQTHPTPTRISLTAISSYLACPFRFFLRFIANMSVPEPDRSEMNQRDFGSLVHQVVENFGNHPQARHLTHTAEIAAFLSADLDQTILHRFGKNPPISIRIQAESARQRLTWFASIQSQIRAEGWEIIDIEKKIIIPSNGIDIVGKIDRIDRNNHTGEIRVIDYKTGNVTKCEQAHRSKLTEKNQPAHIPADSHAIQQTDPPQLWKNLQLPLYALATHQPGQPVPIPCYIHLGKTEENNKSTTWDTFDQHDLASAKACLDWITHSINHRRFWPPTEKVQYDDFQILSHIQSLSQAFSPPAATP